MAEKDLLFSWAPRSLLGVCQLAGNVYSAQYGINLASLIGVLLAEIHHLN